MNIRSKSKDFDLMLMKQTLIIRSKSVSLTLPLSSNKDYSRGPRGFTQEAGVIKA